MISAKPAQNFEGSRADHCRSSLDFRQLAAHGVTLLDRVKAVQNGWLELAPDIAASLAHGDARLHCVLGHDGRPHRTPRLGRTAGTGRPYKTTGPTLPRRTAAATQSSCRRGWGSDLGDGLKR